MNMRILLYDTTLNHPVSPFFVDGLEELKRSQGFEYEFIDEGRFLGGLRNSLIHKIAYRVLRKRPLTYWALNRTLLQSSLRFGPDLVLIGKGAYVAPRTLKQIKDATGAILVNYATDDPFNPAISTPMLVRNVRLYDVFATTKRAISDDVRRAGCSNVRYVRFAYKPSVHFPENPATAEEAHRFDSDAVFIGGCDRDRIPFFELLVKKIPDLRLHLYGGYWDRDPILRRYHRGQASGRDFRLALGGAKIAVNLVRRANRDGHVMRSFEIPACGAFMLTERTEEHLELFQEDQEAAYFDSAEELADKVRHYLAHPAERERIAGAGCRRVRAGGNTYTDRLFEILRAALPLTGRSRSEGMPREVSST